VVALCGCPRFAAPFHQTSSWYGTFRFIAQTVISRSNVRNISYLIKLESLNSLKFCHYAPGKISYQKIRQIRKGAVLICCVKIFQANKNKHTSAHNLVRSSSERRNTICDGNFASITTIIAKNTAAVYKK